MRRLSSLCLLLASTAFADEPVQSLIDHALKHPAGDVPCSFVRADYETDTRKLPVGVFDSGIGGLTVLNAILTADAFNNDNLRPGADSVRDFASERFIYFGDQANMPYGNYPAAGREDLLRELIVRDALFLMGRRYQAPGQSETRTDKPAVKAIVIACNTATAFGLEDIRSAVKAFGLSLPVIGVVEAGARGVMEALPRDGEPDAIGVLATVGTCGCEAYPKAISRAVGLAGKPVPPIIQQGSIGLAGAIEGDPAFVCADGKRTSPYQGPAINPALLAACQFDAGGLSGDMSRPETLQLNTVDNHVRFEVTTLVDNYRKQRGTRPVGIVVLGCTHYPMAVHEIAAAFERLRRWHDASGATPYAKFIRDKIQFIDPAEFTAKELFRELARTKLRLKGDEVSAMPEERFFMTIPNPAWPGVKLTAAGAFDRDYQHSRACGEFDRLDFNHVPMTRTLLPATTAGMIERLMPEVWKRVTP